MEDWQGCLSPLCQTALLSARASVVDRGGYAVTIEDYLLALLQDVEELRHFLVSQGVDLDELTRTIQCEQPIVTEVGHDNLLSAQLVYWFSVAREMTDAPWMDWPELFIALTVAADRLRDKAYVAVLELVNAWPVARQGAQPPINQNKDWSAFQAPFVLADGEWLALIEDLIVTLSSAPDAFVWLRGERGSGKSSLLKSLIQALPGGAIEIDLRREADVLASEKRVLSELGSPSSLPPVLVLDNVSPADLNQLMSSEFSVSRALVSRYPGPILLVGPDSRGRCDSVEVLQRFMGRELDAFTMADTSVAQREAILSAHQPVIERRWGLEFSPGLIEFAAGRDHALTHSPGGLLKWVDRAAARLHLFAERGPSRSAALAGRADALRRKSLVAMARGEPNGDFDAEIDQLAVEQAALEMAWHERQREGSLQMLRPDDLRYELERWLAAAAVSGHYVRQSSDAVEQELA